MPPTVPGDVTRQLRALSFGTEEAAGRLFELVYEQLRGLAAAAFRPGNSPTLQPTALVHEAWLKLRGELEGVRDRQHFLALAGLAMRQVLADRARKARALKRDARRVTVHTGMSGPDRLAPIDLVALDDALTQLAALKERHARVVELRFLAGLTIAETAEALGVSHTTVEADWAMSQAWLRDRLDVD